MPEQATVEQSDIDEMIRMLKEKNGPLPLDTLVEAYIARLRERLVAASESAESA